MAVMPGLMVVVNVRPDVDMSTLPESLMCGHARSR